ncbi:MAG: methyltransferase [Candidatus Eremiobacteraeota bacterium]|nr:methyltransferase [Candidatus Eremiobacteraeota bacterium]
MTRAVGGAPARVPQAPSPAAILELLAGRWVCGAVAAAARLGVADALASGARSSDELAVALCAHAPSLHRLLRALASLGLLQTLADGRFALTSLGEYLRSDVPGSMLPLAQIFALEEHGTSWTTLAYSVASGESAFEHLYGRPLWDYLDGDAELNRTFSDAMTALMWSAAPQIAEHLALDEGCTVADVGGAAGTVLAAILERHPHVRGILYDRPASIEAARRTAPAIVLERAQLVAGDFMRSVPAADVLVLSHVLHDWSDADAGMLLANCRRALAPHGRLVVWECVIEPGDAPDFGKLMDLEMLVLTSGRERTRAEFARLFARAGLELVSVTPLAGGALLQGRSCRR